MLNYNFSEKRNILNDRIDSNKTCSDDPEFYVEGLAIIKSCGIVRAEAVSAFP